MNWILLWFALEVGYMPQGDMLMYESPSFITTAGMFYTSLETRATLGRVIFLGGMAKTFVFSTEGSLSFWPERMLYGFEAGINLGPNLELGFRHFCTHPMFPYVWAGRSEDPTYANGALWEGAYEEVYMRLEGGSK